MKKRMTAAALVLAVLLSGAALAAGGTQSDPLISLSYLNGTYWSALNAQVGSAVAEAAKPIYDEAVSRAGRMQPGAEGWSVSNGFTAQTGAAGGTVTLSVGSGMIWTSGSGTVKSGVLVDVTACQETPSGGALTAGRRYIAAEEAVVAVTSQTAGWLVDGNWKAAEGAGLPFLDVPADSWYYDAVSYVVERKLFQGVSATQFRPMEPMTRGMVTTVLHRLAGEPAVSYSPMFTDVPDGQWYAAGVIWAGQTGVVSGFGNGTFLPDESISRQQFAVILYNYAEGIGCDTSGRSDLTGFLDGAGVAPWAKDAISWAVSEGLMNGSGGSLKPYANAARAEVAAMFQRFQTWLETQ